jgi:hypothetical protein
MDTKKTRELPVRLKNLRRRFEQWRETCKAHARIPDALWDAAVIMADRYGVSRTAHVLRVNYDTLKNRLGRKTMAGSRQAAEGETRFVELTPLASASPFASAGSGECLLELENGGAKMRVRLQGVGTPDLSALVQSFWESTTKATSWSQRFRNRRP